jgi:hypothetical protein
MFSKPGRIYVYRIRKLQMIQKENWNSSGRLENIQEQDLLYQVKIIFQFKWSEVRTMFFQRDKVKTRELARWVDQCYRRCIVYVCIARYSPSFLTNESNRYSITVGIFITFSFLSSI